MFTFSNPEKTAAPLLPNAIHDQYSQFKETKDISSSTAADQGKKIKIETLENEYGKIEWAEPIYLAAEEIEFINIGPGFASIDDEKISDEIINTAAKVTFYDVECESNSIFSASGHYGSADAIIVSGERCDENTIPACKEIQCQSNTLDFSVEHFTGYGEEGDDDDDASLIVWDDSELDGSYTQGINPFNGTTLSIYAHYYNTSANPLTPDLHEAVCYVTITSIGGPYEMSFDGTRFYYNHQFNTPGTYDFMIECSTNGMQPESASDNITVYDRSNIPCGYIARADLTLIGDIDDGSACSGNGLQIGNEYVGEAITIDCADHVIKGDGNTADYGIYDINDHDDVTIKNCNINNFGTGILLGAANNGWNLIDNNLSQNSLYGLALSGADSNTILNNIIEDLSIVSIGTSSNDFINNTFRGEIAIASGNTGNTFIGNNFLTSNINVDSANDIDGNYWENMVCTYADSSFCSEGSFAIPGAASAVDANPYFKRLRQQDVKFTEFDDGSTNFTLVRDYTRTPDLTLIKGEAKVIYTETMDVEGKDLDAQTAMGDEWYSTSTLTSSADVSFMIEDCSDFDLYYLPDFAVYKSDLNRVLVATEENVGGDCIGGYCQDITCVNKYLSFTAAHFDGFIAGEGARLQCDIFNRTEIPIGYYPVLNLYRENNSHVELANLTGYDYTLACRARRIDGTNITLNFTCNQFNNNITLMQLYNVTNSHVSIDGYYDIPVCLEFNQTADPEYEWVDVNVTDADLSSEGYTCVGDIYKDNNSHFSSCGTGNKTIWAKLIYTGCVNLTYGETYDGRVSHSDGTYSIIDNVTLCRGIYNVSTSGIGINMSVGNSVFDCNKSTIYGDLSGTAFLSLGFDNVTLKNCNFTGYALGINVTDSNLTSEVNYISNITSYDLFIDNSNINSSHDTVGENIFIDSDAELNATNLTITERFGTVHYDSLDAADSDTFTRLNITNLSISLDSINLPDFNITANLTFKEVVNETNSVVVGALRNDVSCSAGDTPACTNFIYDAGTLIATYDVESFTNYSIDFNTPPTWSDNKTNATSIVTKFNESVYFNITWTDKHGGNYSVFSYDYGAGTFVNDTPRAWESNPDEFEELKNITGTRGDIIRWLWYANDTLDQWGITDIWNFTVANTPPTIDDVVINSSDGSNDTNQNITGYPQNANDVDSDNITFVYDWRLNGNPLTVLHMPFDNFGEQHIQIQDDFEDTIDWDSNWDETEVTNWEQASDQAHSGTYSAKCVGSNGDNDLISDDIDASSAEAIVVSFWYRDHLIDDSDNVYFQIYNGSAYNDVKELSWDDEDTWHYYEATITDTQYFKNNFRVKFEGSGTDSGENLWIDDVNISIIDSDGTLNDYSSYNSGLIAAGPTWVANGGVNGTAAYEFGDFAEHIRLPDNGPGHPFNQLPSGSITAWIKLNNDSGTNVIIGSNGPGGGYTRGYLLFGVTGNSLYYRIKDSVHDVASLHGESDTKIQNETWTHVALIVNSSGNFFYINGKQSNVTYTNGDNTTNMFFEDIIWGSVQDDDIIYNTIGFVWYNTGFNRQSFNGSIDDFRIYNTPLNGKQIKALAEHKTDTIVSQQTEIGDNWSYCATPNDRYDDGNTLCSVNLTVLAPNVNTPPTWYNNKTNGTDYVTKYGDVVYFNITWNDTDGGSYVIFSYDNGSGVLVNETPQAWTSTPQEFEEIKTIVGTREDVIRWKWYANDTDGVWNETEIWSFIDSNAPPSLDSVILNSTTINNFTTENLTAYPQNPFDDDGDNVALIYDWRLNGSSIALANMNFDVNNSGGTGKTKDYSMFNNDGTITGAAWNSTAGWNNSGAYTFDGDDSINFSGTDIGSAGSFSIWIKPDASMQAAQAVYLHRLEGASDHFGIWDWNDGNLYVGWYPGTEERINVNNNNITYGAWNHIVFVWDNSIPLAELYIDGQKIDNKTDSFNVVALSQLSLGLGSGGVYEGKYGFNGTIDNFILFNHSLSAEQVSALYNNKTDLIVSQETSIGDNWTVEVTPNDGIADGAARLSNDLIVLEETYTGCINLSDSSTWQGKITNNSDGYHLNDNVTLCRDTYYLVDGGAEGAIRFNKSSIYLDCDLSTLVQNSGNVAGTGIYVANTLSNIETRNCIVQDFQEGIVVDAASSNITNNTIHFNGFDLVEADVTGISVGGAHSIIDSNTISDIHITATNATIIGIEADTPMNITISNNAFSNCSIGSNSSHYDGTLRGIRTADAASPLAGNTPTIAEFNTFEDLYAFGDFATTISALFAGGNYTIFRHMVLDGFNCTGESCTVAGSLVGASHGQFYNLTVSNLHANSTGEDVNSIGLAMFSETGHIIYDNLIRNINITDLTCTVNASSECYPAGFYSSSVTEFNNFTDNDITINDANYGISSYLSDTQNMYVSFNRMSDALVGIYLSDEGATTNQNNLVNNNITSCTYSIYDGGTGDDNITYYNEYAKIQWEDVSLAGTVLTNDIGQNINVYLEYNKAGLNTPLLSDLNTTAKLTFYDVSGLSGNIGALRSGVECSANICTGFETITGAGNDDYKFTVSQFTNYSVGSLDNVTANLTIDNNGPKNTTELITFNATYVNGTDGTHIDGADCNLSLYNGSSYMMIEVDSTYYEYNLTHPVEGTHNYNVSCNKTGWPNVTATDTFTISNASPTVIPEFTDYAYILILVVVAGSFVIMRKRRESEKL